MHEPRRASAPLTQGVRVRVPSRGAAHVLTVTTGTLLGPDPLNPGYYRVRLDQPGTYYRADGAAEALPEVVEADDNLEVLPA
jgi:hypothetical protein